ncbi:hypothetical protein PTSG_03576 [Salpingoeca rosetta]|uniref:Uncharacterized protein n=1 Tax=Salpingoeca rosetta (strain ATCC 50818 / BSB-021) TaxID=946362 RepID=F2U602_SALR5|nr:uncharacterized protein PTSG_03576 [Salpingoeca rosetta]EGD82943.1 hypothetical protein PTSG_03576 [Salpingoeca rosetta]|eukprot:XP_004995307.1 hypothetical protein PTSG_03576 [Salpingoeca rosetta]
MMAVWHARVGVACVLALLLVSCGGLLLIVDAAPCPSNSVFLHSQLHGEDYCVCAPGLSCFGKACSYGSSVNIDSFREDDVGFPWKCASCRCGHGTEMPTAPLGQRLLRLQASDALYPDYPDPTFDGMCRITGPAKHPPRALPNATWIHFPKCGTSFTSILYNYLCQGTDESLHLVGVSPTIEKEYFPRTCSFCYKPCNPGGKCKGFSTWAPHDGLVRPKRKNVPYETKMCVSDLIGVVNTHFPVTRKWLTINANIMAMFRNPLTRLRSAYNHARHAFGLSDRAKMVEETKQWSLKQWTTWPGVRGCQTKMVLGQHCGSKFELTAADLEEAKRRVDEHFAFVGLVEAWNTSACLFHRMFGGRIHDHEVLNLRPADPDRYASKFRIANDDDLHELTVADDPIDYALYEHVRAKFVRQLREYGIEVPASLTNPPDIYH